jgi:hypothetical protein
MCFGVLFLVCNVFWLLSVLLANIMTKGAAYQQGFIGHGQQGRIVVPCVLQAWRTSARSTYVLAVLVCKLGCARMMGPILHACILLQWLLPLFSF